MPAGDVCKLIVTAATSPPVAQAVSAHLVASPRAVLATEGTTSTHKVTGAVVAAAPALTMSAVKTAACSAEVLAPALLAAAVLVAALAVAVGVVAVGVGVAVVGVGVGVAVVGVGVGVAVVGVGVGVAVVVVGDGLADAAVAASGSHDSPPVAVAAAAGEAPAPAMTPHEAAASRALPAAVVTALRRVPAKCM